MVGTMTPEKVFHQILALGNAWRGRAVDCVEKDRKAVIRVEETPALWAGQTCPHCQTQPVGGYDHAPQAAVATPQRLSVGIGDRLRPAPGTRPAVPERVHRAGPVGRPQPRRHPGV
jgi:hypothetical protein